VWFEKSTLLIKRRRERERERERAKKVKKVKKVKKGRKKKKATKKSQRANESHSFLRPREWSSTRVECTQLFFFSLVHVIILSHNIVIIKLCEEERTTRAQRQKAEVVSYRALLGWRALRFFPSSSSSVEEISL